MPKYNIKPIDYTDCDPTIAEHLRRGEAIECEVWDCIRGVDHTITFVNGYRRKANLQYSSELNSYMHARPIPIKRRRIMPPERAIPVLIGAGWGYDGRGWLDNPTKVSIQPHMFEDMGKLVENSDYTTWPDCIIEEVDE